MNIFVLGLSSLALLSASLSLGDSVLYIGDSHSYGEFGTVIDRSLRTQVAEVVTIASCGSSAINWVSDPKKPNPGRVKTVCGFRKITRDQDFRSVHGENPKIEILLDQIRPTYTLVALGSNMAAGVPRTHRDSISQLIRTITQSGSVCLWIGPPDAESNVITRPKLKEIRSIIQEESQKYGCTLIDSLPLTQFPKGGRTDGIHYPAPEARKWAERIIPLLEKFIHL